MPFRGHTVQNRIDEAGASPAQGKGLAVAESSAPTVAGSRAVTDDDYELLSSGFAADGVLGQWTQATPVFADSTGRQVKVRAGFTALVGGHVYRSGTSDIVRSISANASGSTRIDMIVLGLDRSTLAVTSYVKAGTPGAGAPPALQRDARGLTSGKWEIPIGMVTVINGAANLAAGDVSNIAWFSRGDAVATASTAPPQPDAASYTRLLHTDTGYEFESVSNAWRRYPWQMARGFIGGKRYTGATTLASIGTSEALTGMDSGSVSLEANRRYRVHVHLKTVSTAGNYMTVRVRETNISGTIIVQQNVWQTATGAHIDWHFMADLTNSSATTKTYVVTLSGSTGTTNVNQGNVSSTGLAGVFVEDLGPSAPNAITNVT